MDGFIRARTEEQVASRQAEILSACAELYEEGGFNAVNLKSISERTSITRPSIYKYYSTKEEILLDLLRHRFMDWISELRDGFGSNGKMSREELCGFLCRSMCGHRDMLSMMSRHLDAIEVESSDEKLRDFKAVTKELHDVMMEGLDANFDSPSEEKERFFTMMISFAFGVCPMSCPTERQRKAMEAVGMEVAMGMEELCYQGLMRLSAGL